MRATPAGKHRSYHTGRIWCGLHGRPHVGTGRTACYARQVAVARALAAYHAQSGAPLALDPSRPETMDALLVSGALTARPIYQEDVTYRADAGGVSCSHHGPIQDQLVHDGRRWSVLVNSRT